MTKEEWKHVEEKLNSAFSRVDLLVDGYAITIRKEPCDKMRLGLTVYVDGTIKGEWVVQDCEIRRKFYYCSERSLLTAKERKKLQKERKAVREAVLARASYQVFSPVFYSFRTLKSHFLKQNTSIELCKEESV